MTRAAALLLGALAVLPLAGCGERKPGTLTVPCDAETIQQAVGKAIPGMDRNAVILGGGDTLRNGITRNSPLQELPSPQRETSVVGNLVLDNDNSDTPPLRSGLRDLISGGGVARQLLCRQHGHHGHPRGHRARAPAGSDYRDTAAPAAQPSMPGELTAHPAPLPVQPGFPDLDAIGVPTP